LIIKGLPPEKYQDAFDASPQMQAEVAKADV